MLGMNDLIFQSHKKKSMLSLCKILLISFYPLGQNAGKIIQNFSWSIFFIYCYFDYLKSNENSETNRVIKPRKE